MVIVGCALPVFSPPAEDVACVPTAFHPAL